MEENKMVTSIGGDASAVLDKDKAEDGRDVGADENGTEISKEQERAEYDRLIRTRFKEFYTEDTQRMINRRFRKYKELEERVREAEENAETVTKRLTDGELFEEIKRSAGEIAEGLAERFCGLSEDISKESESFITLARLALEEGKISLNDAYKLSHFDDILAIEAKRVARETEEKVLADITSRKRRPAENAVRTRVTGGAVDTARLTREERASLAKRAANGEKIRF